MGRVHSTQVIFFEVMALEEEFEHRRIDFKRLILGRLETGLTGFAMQFGNKHMELPSRLALTFQKGGSTYQNFLQKIVGTDVCQ